MPATTITTVSSPSGHQVNSLENALSKISILQASSSSNVIPAMHQQDAAAQEIKHTEHNLTASSSSSSECPSPHVASETHHSTAYESHESSLLCHDDVDVEDVVHTHGHDDEHDEHEHDDSHSDNEDEDEHTDAEGYSSASYSEEDMQTRNTITTTTTTSYTTPTEDASVKDSTSSLLSSPQTHQQVYDADEKNMSHSQTRKMTDPSDRRTIFVKGLPVQITQQEAESLFSRLDGYIKVQLYEPTKDEEKDRARGGPTMAAFVLFDSPQQALLSKDKLNGYVFQYQEAVPIKRQEAQTEEKVNDAVSENGSTEKAEVSKPYELQAKMATKNLFARKEEIMEYLHKKSRKHHHAHHVPSHSNYQHPHHAHHFHAQPLLNSVDPRLQHAHQAKMYAPAHLAEMIPTPTPHFFATNTAAVPIAHMNPYGYFDVSYHSPVMNGGLSTTPPSPTQLPAMPYDMMNMSMGMNELALAFHMNSMHGFPPVVDVNTINFAATMGVDIATAQLIQLYHNTLTMAPPTNIMPPVHTMPSTADIQAPMHTPDAMARTAPANNEAMTTTPADDSHSASLAQISSPAVDSPSVSPPISPQITAHSSPSSSPSKSNGSTQNVGRHNPPCSALFLARLERVSDAELHVLLRNTFANNLIDYKFMIDSKKQRIAFLQFDCIESASAALPRIDGYKGIAAAYSKNPLNKKSKEGDR